MNNSIKMLKQITIKKLSIAEFIKDLYLIFLSTIFSRINYFYLILNDTLFGGKSQGKKAWCVKMYFGDTMRQMLATVAGLGDILEKRLEVLC